MAEESQAVDGATRSEESSNRRRKNRDEMLLSDISTERAQGNDGEQERHDNLVGGVVCGRKKKKLSTGLLDSSSMRQEASATKRLDTESNLLNDANEQALESNGSTHVDDQFKKSKKKKKPAGSLHLVLPVGEASMNKKKKVKCKHKADRRPQENTFDGSSEQSQGCSKPSDPRNWEEHLKIIKTSSDKKSKKASFSNRKDVFPASDSMKHSTNQFELVVGKRYSAEEDEIIKEEILRSLKEYGMGEDDSYKLFSSKIYPHVRGCWKEINVVIPWRTTDSLRFHAGILLHTSWKGKWSNEEI